MVPVRVGVPPLSEARRRPGNCRAARGALTTSEAARELLCVTFNRTPAITSTLPLIPDGAFGVLTGSATYWPDCPVSYRSHLTPNIFCAFLMLCVTNARRCVTSIVGVLPYFLNALITPVRFEDEAPYLLCSVDSDRYLP